MFSDNAVATVTDVEAHNCESSAGGAVYTEQLASVLIADSTLSSGTARAGGGIAAARQASVHLRDTVLKGNYASSTGGGVYGSGGAQIDFTRTTVTGNAAVVSGGGVFCENQVTVLADTTAVLIGTTIENNTAMDGGGVYMTDGILRAMGSVFTANTASTGGGGAVVADQVSNIMLSGCNFTANTAYVGGGAVKLEVAAFADSGDGLINASNFAENVVEAGYGGAVLFYGSTGLAMQGVSFQRNRALSGLLGSGAGFGGAVAFDFASSAAISETYFLDNVADVSGGHLYSINEAARGIFLNESTFGGGISTAGGAVFWTSREPKGLLSETVTFLGSPNANNASYGSDYATPARGLSGDTQLHGVSGQIISPPFVVRVIDSYGQTVRTEDNVNEMTVAPNTDDATVAGGALLVLKGESVYDALIVTLRPNERTMLSVTSEIDFVTDESPGAAAAVDTLKTSIKLRACQVDELNLVLTGGEDDRANFTAQCVKCSDGYFLEKEVCYPCEEEYSCKGEGTTVYTAVLARTYWRGYDDSLENVRECPFGALSCLGGTGYEKGNGTNDDGDDGRRLMETMNGGRNSTFNANNFCREGSTGPLCILCEEGWTVAAEGGCMYCGASGSSKGNLVIGIMGGLFFLASVVALSIYMSPYKDVIIEILDGAGIIGAINWIREFIADNRATIKIYTTCKLE